MKAVIVECSNGAAVALCDDGVFRKVKNRDYAIGQELFIKENVVPNHIMQKLSICASLALFLLSFVGIGSYSYVQPYSYVSLDINPSIEYALNRYDKVIAVSGVNDKGQQVVSSIESDVKNQNITKALGVTIKQLEKEHYIVSKEYNHVIVSVCSSNDTKAQSIASRVDSFSKEESSDCSIDTMTVSKEIKDNADSLGITPGKLALIHAVAETTSASDFDVSEWTDKTVSELETTIQQASSQPSGSAAEPVAATVIDSAYLSSILDEGTTDNSDSTADFSSADKETGSTTTDTQPNTKPDASSEANSSNTTIKPDNTDNTTAADNSTSADTQTDNTTADNSNVSTSNTDKSTTSSTDQVSSSNSDKVPDKGSNSSSNENSQETVPSDTTAADADHKNDDNVLTEDSSSKKDSYPASNTDQVADFSTDNKSDTNKVESIESDLNDFNSDGLDSIQTNEDINSDNSAGFVNQFGDLNGQDSVQQKGEEKLITEPSGNPQ